MAEEREIGKVKIRGRLSFEHLFKKSASVKNGPEKYRCNIIIDPSTKAGKNSIGQIENAIDDIVDDTWKGKRPKFKTDRLCFMDGEDMVDANGDVRDGYDGMKFIKASNDKKPKLRARNGTDEVTEEDDLLYSGAEVFGYLRLFAITDPDKGGNGIFATVEGVQFIAHGEKFGGGGMSDDEFDTSMGDDEDDERPARRRSRSIDDDEERPARRRSRDEDEDERPARRRSRDEDEDERPARRRSRDDDAEDKPARRRNRDEDEEERPARRRNRDDDEEEKPARRRSRDEDEEERPARRRSARDEV